MAINKSIQKKLKDAAKKLEKSTSREDHKKPLSHQEEQFKIDHDIPVNDDEDKEEE